MVVIKMGIGMDISFIIPIYNTEKNKLIRCFDSIRLSDEIKYEVLLIDDGSDEIVKKVCRDYISELPNFKYIRMESEGVSAARNKGISNACGKYIFFIDSDDTINSAEIKKEHLELNVDVVIYDIILVDEKKSIVWSALDSPSGPVNKNEIILSMMYGGRLNSSCAKLVSRELINEKHITFNKNMKTGEDAEFVLRLLGVSSSLYYVRNGVYNYWRTGISSTGRIVRFPQILISNFTYLAMEKMSIVDGLDIEKWEKHKANVSIAKIEVKQLFNIASDLILRGCLSKEVKRQIEIAFLGIEPVLIRENDFLTKVRYAIVKNRFWIVLWGSAVFRKGYLNWRGLHK